MSLLIARSMRTKKSARLERGEVSLEVERRPGGLCRRRPRFLNVEHR